MRPLHTTTLALCLAGAFAMPGAQAGLSITTLEPGGDGLLTQIRSGALDLRWWEMTGHGVASQARYFETRVSQLHNPALGGLEYLNLVADSGWNATQQVGQLVTAFASVDVTPIDSGTFSAPAAAQSSLFGNHVRAHTGDRLSMINDVPVNVGGATYQAFSIYKTGDNHADARSAWYDTWQADASGAYPLTVRLDGSFSHDPGCGVQFCGLTTPAGITSVERRSRQMDFMASFTVLDLDTLVDCDDPDACGTTGPRPTAVAQLTADYRHDGDDSFPLLHDTTHTLDFTAIAGHHYLVIGLMEADSRNGGRVSFENSFRLTGIGAPAGALQSSALGGGDLAAHFPSPVPEPATALLWAGGLAGWLVLRRRARRT